VAGYNGHDNEVAWRGLSDHRLPKTGLCSMALVITAIYRCISREFLNEDDADIKVLTKINWHDTQQYGCCTAVLSDCQLFIVDGC
jgi:hypothetical protein